MKKIMPSPFFLALSAAVSLTPALTAVAHDIVGGLGNNRSAIDVFQVRCFDDGAGPNDHLIASIKDLTPVARPLVSLQLSTSTKALNTTDRVDGDPISSPYIKLKGNGTGTDFYLLSINKTSSGQESYSVQYHCQTVDNQHTGTDTAPIINQ